MTVPSSALREETSLIQLLLFTLDKQQYAIYLGSVIRAVRAVEVTHLPNAPSYIAGVINVRGKIVPVVDLRARFGRKSREVRADDHMILVETRTRTLALHVDEVQTLQAFDSLQIALPAEDLDLVRGVLKLPGGIVLIHDVNLLLLGEDGRSLDAALASNANET